MKKQNKTKNTHNFIKISTFHYMYWLFQKRQFEIHIPMGDVSSSPKKFKMETENDFLPSSESPHFQGLIVGVGFHVLNFRGVNVLKHLLVVFVQPI